MNIFNPEFFARMTVIGRYRSGFTVDCHCDTVRILPCFNSDRCASVFQIDDRGDFDSRCAVLEQLEMLFRNRNQSDLTVKAAIECEVRLLGINRVVILVA